MSSNFNSMGEVLAHIKSDESLSIDERADIVRSFIKQENNGNGNAYDKYLENGAATQMNVISDQSGIKKNCILWCVNHYLSLNRNQNVLKKASVALHQYGTGCGTAATSCGMNSLHKNVEKRLSALLNKDDVVLYPTGFTANMAAVSFLASNKDLILFDRECHSSIINGLKLSKGKYLSFKHNNLADLEKKLNKYQNSFDTIFVVLESAYSMSGDLAPLKDIVRLKQQYPFLLYVDEAHTFGIYGDKGQGYCFDQGVTEDVDFIMSTLSKSTSSIGGFIASNSKYTELMRWTDPYIFQACLTPVDAATVLACLDEIAENPSMIRELHDKNKYMRTSLLSKGFNLGNSQSPLIPIMIEDIAILRTVVEELFDEGIYSTPVLYPAVKANEGRIRLVLNNDHSKSQIDYTVDTLEKICKKYNVI